MPSIEVSSLSFVKVRLWASPDEALVHPSDPMFVVDNKPNSCRPLPPGLLVKAELLGGFIAQVFRAMSVERR